MGNAWPILSYQQGKATYDTLHLWTQIVGKIKLVTLPWVNHSWHVALYISPNGLTTGSIPYQVQSFQIDFDFLDHQLMVSTSQGQRRSFKLEGISVADFYHQVFALLEELDIHVSINPIPSELPNPISMASDTVHDTYDTTVVKDFHTAMQHIHRVFTLFRTEFTGKASPVHFFWGSFDLALSFFSGREAPKHPGGVPGLPNWVAEEAYCREVSSCGFWTGNDSFQEAAFYAYLYPAPKGYSQAKIEPAQAFYQETMGEFVLPYSAVQKEEHPEAAVLAFLNSTYAAGANLAQWDRAMLEHKQYPTGVVK